MQPHNNPMNSTRLLSRFLIAQNACRFFVALGRRAGYWNVVRPAIDEVSNLSLSRAQEIQENELYTLILSKVTQRQKKLRKS